MAKRPLTPRVRRSRTITTLRQEIRAAHAEARAARFARGEMVARVSHELRTPLNVMLSAAGGLRVGLEMGIAPAPDELTETLAAIERNGLALLEIIDDWLDFSRLEAQSLRLFKVPTPLGDLIAPILAQFAPLAAQRGVMLCGPEGTGDELLLVDPARVRQVITNLVSNGIKFTPPGGMVTVRAEVTPTQVTITVRDTGPGIAPDDQALIFQPLQPLDGGLTRKVSGTGLGLWLARKIAIMHDGQLAVESPGIPGAGSAFTLTLPMRPIEPPLPLAQDGPVEVLVIEDDAADALAAMRAFQAQRDAYRVRWASTASVAQQMTVLQQPQLIVLDLVLKTADGTVESGVALFAQLRALPGLTQVPVLVVSAHDLSAAEEADLGAQLAGVFPKDRYEPGDLVRRAAQLFSGAIA